MSNFTQIVSSDRFAIFLCLGKAGGHAVWNYVRVAKPKLPLFHAAAKNGSMDISQYGEILESGWGEKPPFYVEARMKALSA